MQGLLAACSIIYNNIHEKITQFCLGEKGVQFSGNMNQGLLLFCWSLKNVLVLFYSKLRSKSCDYYTPIQGDDI